jgi:hypothetical protein
MTLAQVQRRLDRLESTVEKLVLELDYRESIDAIREGLQSADRGEGETAPKVFTRLRRKLKVSKRR